jgi:MFS family permease
VFFAAVAHFAPSGRSGTAAGGTQIFTMVGATAGPLLFQGLVTWTGRYSTAFMIMAVFAIPIALRVLAQRKGKTVAASR